MKTVYPTLTNFQSDKVYALLAYLVLDPCREEIRRQIMRLLAHMGQPDRGLEKLDRLRQEIGSSRLTRHWRWRRRSRRVRLTKRKVNLLVDLPRRRLSLSKRKQLWLGQAQGPLFS